MRNWRQSSRATAARGAKLDLLSFASRSNWHLRPPVRSDLTMASSWIEYWNGAPTLYSCARHREAHDFDIAFSIVNMMSDARAVVLDFGCGEATRAHFVANRCSKLYLMDAASTVRARLIARYGTCPNIEILGEEWHERLPPDSIDLITLNSVVQYLPQWHFNELLSLFLKVLKPTGSIIISDVIPAHLRPSGDAFELLKFAHAEGFLREAFTGLLRTALSRYTRTRRVARLSKYSESNFIELMRVAGLEAMRAHKNVGHNQRRMTFVAKPRASNVPSQPILSNAAE